MNSNTVNVSNPLILIFIVGLSNFNSKQVTEIILKGKIKPSVLQVECHPYLNQKDLINFCNENSIVGRYKFCECVKIFVAVNNYVLCNYTVTQLHVFTRLAHLQL